MYQEKLQHKTIHLLSKYFNIFGSFIFKPLFMNENEPIILSAKEWLIFELLKEGKSHKMVAAILLISKRTVDTHVGNMFAKNNVQTLAMLIWKEANSKKNR